MPAPAALAVDFVFALTAYALVARWYVVPALVGRPLRTALPPLLLVHLVRPVSLWLLVPGVVVRSTLPAEFATGTAMDDVVAAVLALVATLLVRAESTLAVPAVWIFNVVAFVDALRNIVAGVRWRAPEHMGAAALVPAFVVPALLVSHALVFWVLLAHGRAASR